VNSEPSRCGYQLDSSSLPDDLGSCQCIRPTWNGTQRCVWHVNTDNKTAEQLEPYIGDYPQRIDDAYLCGANVTDQISLREFQIIGSDLSDSDFSNNNMQLCDLRRSDLTDAEFVGAMLYKSDLSGSDLSNTNLSGAGLVGSTIINPTTDYSTDFSGAQLRRSRVRDCSFRRCTLRSDSNPSSLSLRNASYINCDFGHKNFSELNIFGAYFSDCNFRYTNFDHTNLNNSSFVDCVLEDASFNGARVKEAGIRELNLSRSKCTANADFSETIFKNIHITDADFSSSNFSDVNFKKDIKLVRVDFTKSDLTRADIRGANIRRSIFNKATLRETHFDRSRLTYADLSESFAQEATFIGTNLENALFSRADIRDADFTRARLYQAILADSIINDGTVFDDCCPYEVDSSLNSRFGNDSKRLQAAVWTYSRLKAISQQNSLEEQVYRYHLRMNRAQHRVYRSRRNIWNSKYDWIKSIISFLNRWVTRYGEGLVNIFISGIIVFLTFALIYPWIGGLQNSQDRIYSLSPCLCLDVSVSYLLSVYELSFIFSASAIAGTSGRISAANSLVDLFASGESLLGAALVALFIFTLGRQVGQ